MTSPSPAPLTTATRVVAAEVPWQTDPATGRVLALPRGADRAVCLEGPGPVLWRLVQSPTTAERIVQDVRAEGSDGGLGDAALGDAVLEQLRALEAAGLIRRG